MDNRNITFAKLVATPSSHSWSQAYNAGGVFAIVSVSFKGEPGEEPLNTTGKRILSTFEQEYFTLEEKSYETIKKATETTVSDIPENVEVTLLTISIIGDILYAFGKGTGSVLLNRDSKTGTLIDNSLELYGVSGHIVENDKIILYTKSFEELISKETITQALNNPNPSDITEGFAPLIHEHTGGNACAIIVKFQDPVPNPLIPQSEDYETSETQTDYESNESIQTVSATKRKFSFPRIPKVSLPFHKLPVKIPEIHLSHSKKIILTIAVVLCLVLFGSILFANIKQSQEKDQAVFEQIYDQASNKFEQGKSLQDLNSELAKSDLEEAKKIIDEGLTQFNEGSEEYNKLVELQKQIDSHLLGTASGTNSQAQEVEASSVPVLNAVINTTSAQYATRLDNTNYVLTPTAVLSSEDLETTEEIIENNNDWESIGGIGAFGTNVYVLDKESTILKFVPSGSNYSKSNYLTNADSQDFSNAQALAIDSAIYILYSDGSVKKFLRGAEESFSVTGLDKPLSSPTRIYTNADASKLYILDTGNSRIVVLNKTGSYDTQVTATVIKNAKEFTVDEGNKKAYVLVDKKVYEITLP